MKDVRCDNCKDKGQSSDSKAKANEVTTFEPMFLRLSCRYRCPVVRECVSRIRLTLVAVE